MTIEIDRNYLITLENAYKELQEIKASKLPTRYEEIINMTPLEMATVIYNLEDGWNCCSGCVYQNEPCHDKNCVIGIQKYLESRAD